MDETNESTVETAVTSGGSLRTERPSDADDSRQISRCPWCDALLPDPNPGICETCVPDALQAIRSRLRQQ